jgi:hypothetical protein
MNLINFLLLVTIFNSFITIINAIDISRVKNNMLRIYVFSYAKPVKNGFVKKRVINKIKHFFIRSSEKANIYILDANSYYYSLSEEDRMILETILSLTY